MEDVLDVYERPFDPKRPQYREQCDPQLVGMDEQPNQLIGEELIAIPAAPGQVQRIDYQYVRNGTVTNLYVFATAWQLASRIGA
jgi:hypothetical protein